MSTLTARDPDPRHHVPASPSGPLPVRANVRLLRGTVPLGGPFRFRLPRGARPTPPSGGRGRLLYRRLGPDGLPQQQPDEPALRRRDDRREVPPYEGRRRVRDVGPNSSRQNRVFLLGSFKETRKLSGFAASQFENRRRFVSTTEEELLDAEVHVGELRRPLRVVFPRR